MFLWVFRVALLGMVLVLNYYGNQSPCDSWYSFDSCEVISQEYIPGICEGSNWNDQCG